jgi:hypothetical protein
VSGPLEATAISLMLLGAYPQASPRAEPPAMEMPAPSRFRPDYSGERDALEARIRRLEQRLDVLEHNRYREVGLNAGPTYRGIQ